MNKIALCLALLSACSIVEPNTNAVESALGEGFVYDQTADVTTSEYLTADAFFLSLATQPTADVTIAASSSDTTEATVLPASVTFTSANWATPRQITATGVNDSLIDGNIAFTIVLGAAVSADTGYNGLDPADVAATNDDNEEAVTISTGNKFDTTEAGGSRTYKIKLLGAPSANVTCTNFSTDTTEGVAAPSSLTFTSSNWGTYQTVTVTGQDDAIVDGDINYTIVNNPCTSTDNGFNNRNVADVHYVNKDND